MAAAAACSLLFLCFIPSSNCLNSLPLLAPSVSLLAASSSCVLASFFPCFVDQHQKSWHSSDHAQMLPLELGLLLTARRHSWSFRGRNHTDTSSSRSTTRERRLSSTRQAQPPRASTISWTHFPRQIAAMPSTISTLSLKRIARRARSSSSHDRLQFLAFVPRCCMLHRRSDSGASWMGCTMRFRQCYKTSLKSTSAAKCGSDHHRRSKLDDDTETRYLLTRSGQAYSSGQ